MLDQNSLRGVQRLLLHTWDEHRCSCALASTHSVSRNTSPPPVVPTSFRSCLLPMVFSSALALILCSCHVMSLSLVVVAPPLSHMNSNVTQLSSRACIGSPTREPHKCNMLGVSFIEYFLHHTVRECHGSTNCLSEASYDLRSAALGTRPLIRNPESSKSHTPNLEIGFVVSPPPPPLLHASYILPLPFVYSPRLQLSNHS